MSLAFTTVDHENGLESNEETRSQESADVANPGPSTPVAGPSQPKNKKTTNNSLFTRKVELFKDNNIRLTVREERFQQPKRFNEVSDKLFVIRSEKANESSRLPLLISSLEAIYSSLRSAISNIKESFSGEEKILYLVSTNFSERNF